MMEHNLVDLGDIYIFLYLYNYIYNSNILKEGAFVVGFMAISKYRPCSQMGMDPCQK